LLINGRIQGLHVIQCIDAGNTALRYLVGHRSIKIKEIIIHYPSDDPDIVADGRLTPAQEKLANCVVMIVGSGLKSAKKEKKVTSCKQTASLPCISRAIT
jgi:hypothetical protein